MVGVNAFELEEEKPIPLQHIDESLERKQVERFVPSAPGAIRRSGRRR